MSGSRFFPRGNVVAGAFLVSLLLSLTSIQLGQADQKETEASPTFNERARTTLLRALDRSAQSTIDLKSLSRGEAVEVASAIFGQDIDGIPALLQEPPVVEKYLSPYSAVVSDPESAANSPAILESTLPLRLRNEDGVLRPVNLTLKKQGRTYSPDNPYVETTLPSVSGGGFTLDDLDVGITPEVVVEDRQASVMPDGGLHFANVAKDKDLIVSPVAGGVETFSILRSADSPPSDSYSVDLPPDARLERTSEGGAAVKSGDETILEMPKPWALDAAGKEVPVRVEVTDRKINVSAVTTATDIEFPVLVDPLFEDTGWTDFSWADSWVSSTTPPNSGYLLRQTCIAPFWCNVSPKEGLYIDAFAGTYPVGAVGSWNYYVPRYASDLSAIGSRPSTYITSASLGGIKQHVRGSTASMPAMFIGLFDPTSQYFGSLGAWNYEIANEAVDMYPSGNPSQMQQMQQVSFGYWALASGTLPTYRDAYAQIFIASLTDKESPSIGAISPPEQWVDTAKVPLGLTVTDPGLGVKQIRVRDGSTILGVKEINCDGTTSDPCPRTWSSSSGDQLMVNPSSLPTGVKDLEVEVKDPLGQTGTAMAQFGVDHTAPVLDVTGSIMDVEGTAAPRSEYSIEIQASDGDRDEPQSGVQSYEVRLDGQIVQADSEQCVVDSCFLGGGWDIAASELGSGNHVVSVKAIDGVGRYTTKQVAFQVPQDTTEPIVNASDDLLNSPPGGLEGSTYELVVEGSDAGFGVSSLDVFVDGDLYRREQMPCQVGGCDLDSTFEIVMEDFSEGVHDVTVVATDGFDNRSEDNFSFEKSQGTPVPAELTFSGRLANAAGGWVKPDTYTLDLMTTASDAWGTKLEIFVDDTLVEEEEPCSVQSCTAETSVNVDLGDIEVGQHQLRAVATDLDEVQRSESFVFNISSDEKIDSGEALDIVEVSEPDLAAESEVTSEQVADGIDPTVELDGGTYETVDTIVPTTISSDPSEGFTVEQLDGSVIEVETDGDPSLADDPVTSEETSIIFGTTSESTDSVVKPLYNGVMDFRQIRSSDSSEEYTWTVQLSGGQTLASVTDEMAEVRYANGRVAMAIASPAARDAIGRAIPTTLSVSGNEVTLTIDHVGLQTVYPVSAGTAWQPGYKIIAPITLDIPPAPPEEESLPDVMMPGAEQETIVDPPIVKSVATISGNRRKTQLVGAHTKVCSKAGCWVWRVEHGMKWMIAFDLPFKPIKAWHDAREGSGVKCQLGGSANDVELRLESKGWRPSPAVAHKSQQEFLKSYCNIRIHAVACFVMEPFCKEYENRYTMTGRAYPNANYKWIMEGH